MTSVSGRIPAGASLWRDLAIAVAVAVGVAWVATLVELNERVFQFTRRWEHYQLDEWPAAVLAFALCMVALYARRHAQLRRALVENRALVGQVLDVQEQERRRLARELHDELGQTLNVVKLDARALADASADPGVTAIAQRIAGNADDLYRTAGTLVSRLRPPALDELGLVAALEACVDRWRGTHPTLQVRLSAGGEIDGLGETRNLAIYRIVQEALTNTVRHAQAQSFSIDLTREPGPGGRVLLELRDDGRGFDASHTGRHGSGLTGIRERVALLGGRFELLTATGQGCALRIELPAAPVQP